MRRVGFLVLALVGVAACVENELSPGNDGPAAGSGMPETCPEADPDDGIAALTGTCTLPAPDWDVQVKWTWDADDHLQREAHLGRFTDADGDGVITLSDPTSILLNDPARGHEDNTLVLLSAEGTVEAADLPLDGWGLYATVGDVAPEHVGMEYVLGGLSSDDSTYDLAIAAPGELLWSASVEPQRDFGPTWLFLLDLEADGAPEVLGDATVTSASDGHVLFSVPASHIDYARNVAADLDLDGFPEIIASIDLQPVILDHEGALRATCPILDIGPSEPGNMVFALGNLDGDPEGEIVAARPGLLAICEADGTLDAGIATAAVVTGAVGLAELTGDDEPEIIVDEQRTDTPVLAGITAYDHDLEPLWRADMAEADARSLFSVVDLDGDGRHEIVVQKSSGGLRILAPDGTTLVDVDGPADANTGTGPIVADVDGDGLAEIVLAGTQPKVAVYTNAAGGWPLAGADRPWPGIDHFPGDRNLDGTLPDPGEVPWAIPGHNVWQGLAPGFTDLPDLGVELTDACSEDCETTTIIAAVWNAGAVDVRDPVTVELWDGDEGDLLQSEMLANLPAGVRREVEFRVRSAAIGSGVRAEVTTSAAECTDVPNVATLTDLPCQ